MTNNIKCNANIHDFMENYKFGFNPITKESGVFEYHDFEKKIVNLINDNRFSIILKSRQVYVSTILAAYATWQILNGKKIGIYMFRLDLAKNFLTKVRMMLKNYGINNEVNFKRERLDYIELDNGGLIKGLSTPVATRGYTFDEVIYDEAAYIQDFEESISIGLSTLATGGKAILASTPNGLCSFYKIWEASIKGENDFKRIKITFKDVPDRDEDWLEHMKRTMNYNEKMIRQELYAEFVVANEKKNKKNKNKLIQFRVNEDLFNKLSMKLIENDINISTYMRKLILKDVDD